MHALTRSGTITAALSLTVAGVLTGCAPEASSAPSAATEIEVSAAWLDAGRMVGIVTTGSSSCVPIAEAATLGADGALEVTLVDPGVATGQSEQACTADLAPRLSLVGVPEGVDPSQPLTIDVSYGAGAGEVVLAGVEGLGTPVPGTDYANSAGWVTGTDSFALLTWGSSSCAPTIETIETTGDAQVTVTFTEPAADRMCTLDMAPRGLLVATDGVTAETGVVAVLDGDGFAGAQVTILGTR